MISYHEHQTVNTNIKNPSTNYSNFLQLIHKISYPFIVCNSENMRVYNSVGHFERIIVERKKYVSKALSKLECVKNNS